MKIVMKDIFLKFMFNILKKYMTFTIIYHFRLKTVKIEKVEKLVGRLQVFQLFQFSILHDKKICFSRKKFKLVLNHRLVLRS